ncbi:MAG: lysoplasmalogenase [Fibrobacteraceae bacterium]|nr:lysoplasmalogenase [Fibrobacteraceae bacterium]
MSKKLLIFFVVELIMLSLLIATRVCGWGSIADLAFKTLASMAFVAMGITGLCEVKNNGENANREVSVKYAKSIIGGLVCALLGDVFLDIPSDGSIFFIIGVACFAFAHVCYSIGFFKVACLKAVDFLVMLGVFGITLCFLLFGGTFEFKGLFPVLLGYAAIISFMVAKAISLYRNKDVRKQAYVHTLVGALLFIASDIILLYCLFGVNTPLYMTIFNLITYYLGQAFIASPLGKGVLKD